MKLIQAVNKIRFLRASFYAKTELTDFDKLCFEIEQKVLGAAAENRVSVVAWRQKNSTTAKCEPPEFDRLKAWLEDQGLGWKFNAGSLARPSGPYMGVTMGPDGLKDFVGEWAEFIVYWGEEEPKQSTKPVCPPRQYPFKLPRR